MDGHELNGGGQNNKEEKVDPWALTTREDIRIEEGHVAVVPMVETYDLSGDVLSTIPVKDGEKPNPSQDRQRSPLHQETPP